MARIGVKVEATEESTQQMERDFTNLPNGDYILEITASAVPESGEGTANHKLAVNVTIDVIEPAELKGRKIFQNYNLINPSLDKNGDRKAEQIGNQQFSCLLRALGKSESPEESDELHFIAFHAKVGVGKASVGKDGTQYPARNEIKKYYYPDLGEAPPASIDANQPAPAAPANDNKPAARQAAAPEAKKNPWTKKA